MRGFFDVEVFDPDLEFDDFELFEYEEEYLDDDLEFDEEMEWFDSKPEEEVKMIKSGSETAIFPLQNPEFLRKGER